MGKALIRERLRNSPGREGDFHRMRATPGGNGTLNALKRGAPIPQATELSAQRGTGMERRTDADNGAHYGE